SRPLLFRPPPPPTPTPFPTRRSSDLVPRLIAPNNACTRTSPAAGAATASARSSARPGATYQSALACIELSYILKRRKNQPCSNRSEEHTSELQSPYDLVCRLLLEKKK